MRAKEGEISSCKLSNENTEGGVFYYWHRMSNISLILPTKP